MILSGTCDVPEFVKCGICDASWAVGIPFKYIYIERNFWVSTIKVSFTASGFVVIFCTNFIYDEVGL